MYGVTKSGDMICSAQNTWSYSRVRSRGYFCSRPRIWSRSSMGKNHRRMRRSAGLPPSPIPSQKLGHICQHSKKSVMIINSYSDDFRALKLDSDLSLITKSQVTETLHFGSMPRKDIFITCDYLYYLICHYLTMFCECSSHHTGN